MSKTRIIKTMLIAGLLVLTAVPAMAQTEMDVTFTWTPPTTGTAVVHYVVQHSVNGGTWAQIATTPTNNYTLTASVGDSHQLRVAGVDAENRQGPYSEPSDPYSPDPGSPGAPGKPVLF